MTTDTVSTTTKATTAAPTAVAVYRRRKGGRWQLVATVATMAEALALSTGSADWRFREAKTADTNDSLEVGDKP